MDAQDRQSEKPREAVENLNIEIGRAFVSAPPIRWLFRKLGLRPKEKYR